MPCLSQYCRFLARYPSLVLLSVLGLSVLAIVTSLTLRDLPDFSDPQVGFETRGTEISLRLTMWDNLVDSISHLGPLTSNPKEASKYLNKRKEKRKKEKRKRKRKRGKKKKPAMRNRRQSEPNSKEQIENANGTTTKGGENLKMFQDLPRVQSIVDMDFDDEDNDFIEPPEAEPILLSQEHMSIAWMCGEPMADYAHVVFEPINKDEDLFTHSNILSMCTLESIHFRSAKQFPDLCETKGPVKCCPGWNLGLYVGLLNNKSSCFGITPEDVENTRELLLLCSRYYHNGDLYPDCLYSHRGSCSHVPRKCTIYNAIYTILHFLTDKDFMDPEVPYDARILKSAVSFLPVARSSSTLDFYYSVSKDRIADKRTHVVAMDLGLAETLFDEYLIEDASYVLVAMGLIFIAILLYTHSFFLTCTIALSIIFSLALAYAIYTFVFMIEFFPFMNVLAVVIAIGVGADDSFILLKSWTTLKPDPNEEIDLHIQRIVAHTMEHCTLSMLVTSLTTSIAFLASYVSHITAIKCFSIFASLAIFSNFVLMMTWIPTCLVFYQRYCHATCCCCLRTQITTPDGRQIEELDSCYIGKIVCNAKENFDSRCKHFFEKTLPVVVIQLRVFWILFLGSAIIASVVIIFYRPGLKLPEQEQFQLFTKDHQFERYNLEYQDKYAFEREENRDIGLNMPLRFIWGLKPVDHGDFLNPGDRGEIEIDPTFDIATLDAQRWMLKFCEDIRKQPFFSSSSIGPLLPNCYMKTFKETMERRCKDDLSGKNRQPCCQASKFPYTRPVFEKCLLETVEELYETPTSLWIPGVAGPKFNVSNNIAEVVIVEYDAEQVFSYSHEKMLDFYQTINSWFQDMMSTAPKELRSGLFTSYLDFFDVQNSLLYDTVIAIAVAMVIAVLVLFLCTFNVLLSVISVVNICGIISITIAILTLVGWQLNILESVAITLAIGLSVDFTLHYAIMYKLAIARDNNGDVEGAVTYALANMGAPVGMGAFTTLIAGVCLLPSRVLAYIQIGTFIVTIMSVSWIMSTFFFLAVLCVCGPKRSCSLPMIPIASKKVEECLECWETEEQDEDQIERASKTFQNPRVAFHLPSAPEAGEVEINMSEIPAAAVQTEVVLPRAVVASPSIEPFGAKVKLICQPMQGTRVVTISPVVEVSINSQINGNNNMSSTPVINENPPLSMSPQPPQSIQRRRQKEVIVTKCAKEKKKKSVINGVTYSDSCDFPNNYPPPRPLIPYQEHQQPTCKLKDTKLKHNEVFEKALIHCDTPTIRTDPEYHKHKRLRPVSIIDKYSSTPDKNRKHSLAGVATAAVVTAPVPAKRKSRQKSLPGNSLEMDPMPPIYPISSMPPPMPLPPPVAAKRLSKHDVVLVTPPINRGDNNLVMNRLTNMHEKAEEAERVKEAVIHRRKNSYKKATERQPIDDWNLKNRRKSVGHLDEEQRKQSTALKKTPRTSSSLGNILQDSEDDPSSATTVPVSFPLTIHMEKLNDPSSKPNSAWKLKSSYHYERHPLSHSTTSILDDHTSSNDPCPVLPNKCPGTPDIWIPRKAFQY